MAEVAGFVLNVLTFYGIYLILALSFNIEYGFAGLPNFGKVLFYSIGAYLAGSISAWIAVTVAGFTEGDPGKPVYCAGPAYTAMTEVAKTSVLVDIGVFLLSLVVALIVGAVIGVISSYPTLRLRGDFLAISLLALGEIVRIAAYTEYWPVCGYDGLSGIPTPFAWMGDAGKYAYTALVWVIAGGVYFTVQRMTNSPWGRALKSVRDDELAAEVYGKNIARVKAQAMAVGSALAALAGVLYAFHVGGVFAADFIPLPTFLVIAMVMLGGPANNKGVVLGTGVIVLIDQLLNASVLNALGIPLPQGFLNAVTYLKYVLMGVIIILILMFRPQGLIPEKPLDTPIVRRASQLVSTHRPTQQTQAAKENISEREDKRS